MAHGYTVSQLKMERCSHDDLNKLVLQRSLKSRVQRSYLVGLLLHDTRYVPSNVTTEISIIVQVMTQI